MAAALALGSVLGASAAFANSAANADIAAPLRAEAASSIARNNGDAQFRQLFSSLQTGDKIAGFAAAGGTPAPQSVSIPSTMPVEGTRLTSEFGMRWHPVLGGRRAHAFAPQLGRTPACAGRRPLRVGRLSASRAIAVAL